MKKVLIIAIVILSLLLAALAGLIWYQGSHVFVEGTAYAKNAEVVDLRGQNISEAHYLTVQQALPDSRVIWDVPFQGGKASSDARRLAIASVQSEDIRMLKAYFPDLSAIDASACTDYAMLALLAGELPGCDVQYTVDLGGVNAAPDTEQLVLEQGSYDAVKEYDGTTTRLDLSDMKSIDVEAVAAKLPLLPNLEEVELMGASGSYLLVTDVQKLKAAAPEVSFRYSFDFYGVTVSTSDSEVILKKLNHKAMPDTGIAGELRAMLDIMDNCQRIVVDGLSQYDRIWTKISNAELAALREEYRDKTSVVWRVYFGANGGSLTDAEVLRAVYGLSDGNSANMKYLEKVRYMDIGHNEFLTNADFVSGMVSLEAVIISGAPIESLEPFRACKELKFLEMAECRYITDLSPLQDCTKLEMLNISQSEIADLSPIMDMELTHLNTVANDVPEEDIEAYMAKYPSCWVVNKGNHYGEGWRYNTDGTLLPWYAKLDAEYHYISQQNIPNNSGWYLP